MASEEDLTETMSKGYGIAYDHALDKNEAKKRRMLRNWSQMAMRRSKLKKGGPCDKKSATRIIGSELIHVGGPKMMLGGNCEVVLELASDDDSADAGYARSKEDEMNP